MPELNVVGMLRIKNEARWIQQVLRSIVPVCHKIYVLDDHSTDSTTEIVRQFPQVHLLESVFDDFNEARDKDYLLHQILQTSDADYVLAIDGDEELERSGVQKIQTVLTRQGADSSISVWTFQILYLWDRPDLVRVDGVYQNFFRPSLFKIRGESARKLMFQRTTAPHNLHCSNFPQGLRGRIVQSDVRLKHYGYMMAEDRSRKYEWYNRIDPGSVNEDGYKHIIEQPNRHAPGPVQLAPLVE